MFITIIIIGGWGGGGGYNGSIVVGSVGVVVGGSIGVVAVAAAVDISIINIGVVCMTKFCEKYCRCCVSFILHCSISVAGGIAATIFWNTI